MARARRFLTIVKWLVAIFFIITMVMGAISGIGAAYAAINAMQAECNIGDFFCHWLVAFGFPPQFLNTDYIFWYAILPLGIIAVSIYVVFSYAKNVIPGLNDWAIGIFSIFGALATVPTKLFLVFVGTTMVLFGTYSFAIMILIGFLAGIGALDRIWTFTKVTTSPKVQKDIVESLIKSELKYTKETSKVFKDTQKWLAEINQRIKQKYIELDQIPLENREARIAKLHEISELEKLRDWISRHGGA